MESAHHISRQPKGTVLGGKPNVLLYGQEKNLGTWAIAKLNLYLHNMSADIKLGDTLVNPKHLKNGFLQTFDRVIANPPFSAKAWWEPLERSSEDAQENGQKIKSPNYKLVSDPHNRLVYGIPPRGYADLAFAQHMLASLKADGRMGIILPHGVLFRSGEEGKIRNGLLFGTDAANGSQPGDLIEAIVGLPSALFYNTGIPACVLILNKSKPKALKDKVIIIDASRDYLEGKAQNNLRFEDIARIVGTHKSALDHQTEVEKYCRVVPLDEIRDNEGHLNIARYIDNGEIEETIDVAAILLETSNLAEEGAQIDSRLNGYLAELKFAEINNDLNETVVGAVPKYWSIRKLEDITGFITKGGTPTTYGFDWVDGSGGIPFFRSECVTDDGFNPKGMNFISADAHQQMKRSEIKPGDLLMTITGNIGRVARAPIHFSSANINQHIARIRIQKGMDTCDDYVYQCLKHDGYVTHYRAILTGQAYPQISLKQVRETPIPLPPLPEQQKIADILRVVDEKLDAISRQLEVTKTLKRGLMQKLLTGEWRVKIDDPIPTPEQ